MVKMLYYCSLLLREYSALIKYIQECSSDCVCEYVALMKANKPETVGVPTSCGFGLAIWRYAHELYATLS